MGKKIKKIAKVQNFSKRKEEEELLKESPFSSIVLKEKKEEPKKKGSRPSAKKRASEVVQGYDPKASFADILANYERTGNPYAMPKRRAESSKSLSFGDILDKWEGKDKKKTSSKRKEEREKSSYKATKSFAEILSEFEGEPVSSSHRETVIDEEVTLALEPKKDKKAESPLFRKETEDETRSPEASWSIYGNNESFERAEKEESPSEPEPVEKERKEEAKPASRSSYKATKDFGDILKGFYESHEDMPSSSPSEPVRNEEEEELSPSPFMLKESDDLKRSTEASWSIVGNNDSFVRKEEKSDRSHSAMPDERRTDPLKKKEYRGKKEFAKILDTYNSRKKEKDEVKTFDQIIKEKGDVPEKKEYTVSQLRTMLPQATLDLHGKTQEEAEEAVNAFLADCRSHKIRKISIITGKGLHSDGGVGVLKDAVIRLLDNDGGISERTSAPVQYGGSGALWVILKR